MIHCGCFLFFCLQLFGTRLGHAISIDRPNSETRLPRCRPPNGLLEWQIESARSHNRSFRNGFSLLDGRKVTALLIFKFIHFFPSLPFLPTPLFLPLPLPSPCLSNVKQWNVGFHPRLAFHIESSSMQISASIDFVSVPISTLFFPPIPSSPLRFIS